MNTTLAPVSGGRVIHVTIIGAESGEIAVALHGLGGNTEQNLPALEAVATAYGLRIYAFDLPNHGRSGKVGLFNFRVRYFRDLIVEAITALEIQPVVLVGHSFGGQLAAMVAEALPYNVRRTILINPAIGATWDRKLRACWRLPIRFLRLIQELGYNETNIDRGEVYHARRLLGSARDLFTDRNLNPYRRMQVTTALILERRTAAIVERLQARGIQPFTIQGAQDRATPATGDALFVDGFHSWIHEDTGPNALVRALRDLFSPNPGPA